MVFNRELAEELVSANRDRDRARYFAGREAEIQAVQNAFREAPSYTQTTFRVFTGAPGCGKSSLLTHVRETYACDLDVLFVTLAAEDAFESRADLFQAATAAALNRAPPEGGEDSHAKLLHRAARLVDPVAQAVGEMVRIKNAGGLIRDWYRSHRLNRLTVVFVCDEAQNLAGKQLRALRGLHSIGLDFNDGSPIPSVILMAGLSPAKQRLDDAEISRTAHNADVDMGSMTREECAASTMDMLAELRVAGTGAECRSLAKRVADLSRQWPQHLMAAQESLCRTLLEVDGVLRDVDQRELDRLADEARGEYYKKRARNWRFGNDSELVQRIVVDLDGRNEPVRTDANLRGVCRAQIEALGRTDDVDFDLTPKRVANGLVRKGVVCHENDRYIVPIPSMVAWAKEQLRERERERGGLTR